jgi:hypothetical protein
MQSPGRKQQDEKKKRDKSKRMCVQRFFVSSNQTRSTALFMNRPTLGFSRACVVELIHLHQFASLQDQHGNFGLRECKRTYTCSPFFSLQFKLEPFNSQ